MAYAAARGEIDLGGVIDDALRSGRVLLLPRCEAPGVMTARRVESRAQLAPGTYGLLEPVNDCAAVPAEQIDLILVPGVAFDVHGGRLGQGGGYYDRFLAGTDALLAGICHSFALMEHVPAQAHDKNMDMVITPDACMATADNTGRRRRRRHG